MQNAPGPVLELRIIEPPLLLLLQSEVVLPPWGHSEVAEAPTDSLEIRGKGPSLGRTVFKTRPSSTGAHLPLALLILGGHPTEILAQFFKYVFSRLHIKLLMKLPGTRKTLMSIEKGWDPLILVHMEEGS